MRSVVRYLAVTTLFVLGCKSRGELRATSGSNEPSTVVSGGDASTLAPAADAGDPTRAPGESGQHDLFAAIRELRDPAADAPTLFQNAVRATFAASATYFSQFEASEFHDGVDLSGSSDLRITLGKALRVPAREGTRSCAGRHPCRAVALSVRATNVGVTPIRLRLRQEYHGGALLPSSLAACARAVDASEHVSCDSAYLVESAPPRASPVVELTLAPARTTSFDIRLDWSGTGSLLGSPLVDPARGARYEVAVGLVFRAGNVGRVAYSDVATVVVPDP